MVSKDEVISALKSVKDPEIGLPITELKMIKDVKIDGEKVDVLVALTIEGCPMADTLQNDVNKAVSQLPGVKSVNVKLTSMTQEELENLKASLQSRSANAQKAGGTPPGIDMLDKKGIRNIIAVVSGKGGVGKSFVTSMLATELKRQGYEVGVLDADITGPSIAKIFGVNRRPTIGEKGVIPSETTSGIKVISINLLLDDPQKATIWRGPIVTNVIRQLYNEVDWGELHYLLIDLPPGTSDAPLTIYQSIPVDGIAVVTTPQDLALMIVGKATNMARKMNVDILGVIENMSYVKCTHCGEKLEVFGKPNVERAANKLEAPVLGQIPIDQEIAECSDKGLIEKYENEAFTTIVKELRDNLASSSKNRSEALPIAWNTKKGQSKLKMHGT